MINNLSMLLNVKTTGKFNVLMSSFSGEEFDWE